MDEKWTCLNEDPSSRLSETITELMEHIRRNLVERGFEDVDRPLRENGKALMPRTTSVTIDECSAEFITKATGHFWISDGFAVVWRISPHASRSTGGLQAELVEIDLWQKATGISRAIVLVKYVWHEKIGTHRRMCIGNASGYVSFDDVEELKHHFAVQVRFATVIEEIMQGAICAREPELALA